MSAARGGQISAACSVDNWGIHAFHLSGARGRRIHLPHERRIGKASTVGRKGGRERGAADSATVGSEWRNGLGFSNGQERGVPFQW